MPENPDDVYEIVKLELGISNLPALAKRMAELERRFDHLCQAVCLMQGCPVPFGVVFSCEPGRRRYLTDEQEDAPVRKV